MLQQNYTNGHFGSNGNGRDPRFIEGIVANLPLFRDVGRSNVALIASYARIEHCRRGALIARQGERLPGVIALAYGLAKLVLPRRKGEEKVLRFLGANESFGEAAVLLDRPCPVEVVALEDAMLTVIPLRPIKQLQERDITFANNLVKTLAGGLLRLVAEIDANIGRSSAQRLAAYLESLAEPESGTEACAIALPVTKTTLAARLGITKETMSRLLRDLKEQGLIAMTRGNITILDRARLSGLSRDASDSLAVRGQAA
ncbi:MAG TPA: Crp/Fnr family transcriptional regulator [Burkholderiales bacterium]|nr:Crp/Fnr family transcriptional regulator [Burkholderiales bacterium]